jgi:hypothetical protein
MNTTGKEWMAELVASNIKQILTRQKRPPITSKWKDDQVDFSSNEVIFDIQSDSASESKDIVIRTSRRQRKTPMTIHEDFLWTVDSSKIIY